METEVKLTKLASCAGCGAKVGAGTLAKLLDGFKTHTDPRLIVGFDKSDDASVYVVDEETAIVQTTDFFPPIVDDPYLFGQIAAANALSDIYAMGGEPKLALNIMCVKDSMDAATVREILRGGYEKAYEAGAIISGGHTIHGAEPIYGLAVTGFVHPSKVLTNSGAKPGDVLILTKPLGVGIITTAAKAGLVEDELMSKLYRQMATLNKAARDIMVRHNVNSCTDVTGFALLGHSFEMAQGSGCTLHISAKDVPYHEEAFEFADMGFIPAGAYRNREYAEHGVSAPGICRPLLDIMYDPQTSGGLLISSPKEEAERMLGEFADGGLFAVVIGHVTGRNEGDPYVVVE
ncbi:MAG: selenide, water dikinase SelD [Lachnospiraceae bacterium]|nr:selenide, water dikinase SelD [Lachnospiraceae bacterium]